MKKSKVDYALRLPKKVYSEMKRLAKEEDRSLNWMIIHACEELILSRPNKS